MKRNSHTQNGRPHSGDSSTLPLTSTSLLDGLARGEQGAEWQELCGRYLPVLRRFTRQLGLDEHESEDAAQEALLRFVRQYRAGHYQRERGRLRSFMFTVAHSVARDLQRRSWIQRGLIVNSEEIGDQAQTWAQTIWEEEWERELFARALDRLRPEVEPHTMEAFECFALRGESAASISARLGMTENSIYLAKRRLLRRLRELINAMNHELF